MSNTISVRVWQEGAAVAEKGSVRKISRESVGTGWLYRASVQSSFGFVHHPAVELDAAQRTVTRFACDCWNAADNTVLCVHCAALLAKTCEENRFTVTATPTGNRTLSAVARAVPGDSGPAEEDKRRVQILSQEQEGGRTLIKGRVRCDFGFVHYPSITVEQGRMADFACNCYEMGDKAGACSHCELLWLAYMDEHGTSAQDTLSAQEDELFPIDFRALPSDGEKPAEEISFAAPAENKEQLSERAEEPENADEFLPVKEELPGLFAEEPENKQEELQPEPAEEPAEPFSPQTMQILLGHDRQTGKKVIWRPNDTEQLVHVNTGIIGTMGTGKTQVTKSLVTQLYRQQRHNFDGSELGILIFDYKGDYNQTKQDFFRATNAMVLKLHNLPYNPFSLRGLTRKPQLPYHVASSFATILTKIYHLGPVQHNTLLHCIISAYERCGITAAESTWNKDAPTFEQVYQIYYEENPKQDALFSAMYALHQFEIFEAAPWRTTSLYDLLKGVVVLDLSGYDSRIQNLAVAITLEIFCSQMLNSGSSKWNAQYRQLTKLLLVDEADNIMAENFPALKRILKEGREFGVGTILSTQSFRHFATDEEEYAGYILTWIVHTVPDLKRADAEFLLKVHGEKAEALVQEIAFQHKHESVAKIGNAEPVCLYDQAFWQLADDDAETYLAEEEEPTEGEEA